MAGRRRGGSGGGGSVEVRYFKEAQRQQQQPTRGLSKLSSAGSTLSSMNPASALRLGLGTASGTSPNLAHRPMFYRYVQIHALPWVT